MGNAVFAEHILLWGKAQLKMQYGITGNSNICHQSIICMYMHHECSLLFTYYASDVDLSHVHSVRAVDISSWMSWSQGVISRYFYLTVMFVVIIIIIIMHPFLQRKINRPQLRSWQFKQCLQVSRKSLQRNGCRADVSWQTQEYWSQGVASLPHKCQPPLSSARQHPSYGDCLEVKRKYYQNCSVLGCV